MFLEAAYTFVFRPTEEFRRWGMTCACPHHVKMRVDDGVKHVPCFWNGKKLGQAWEHLQNEKAAVMHVGQTIKDEDCEGNTAIRECIVVMLAKKMATIHHLFGYYSVLPWAYARAGSVAGAEECMRLLRSKPLEHHDPLARAIAARVGGDIDARARGEDMTPALAEQVDIIATTSLIEDLGEGYHRDTNIEKRRAAGSTERHLEQVTRFKLTIRK